MLDILRHVLRRDDIGRDDNIFTLGADSLTTIEFLLAIEKAFNVRIPVQQLLYETSTVAQLAEWLRRATGASAGPDFANGPDMSALPKHGGMDLAVGYEEDAARFNALDIVEGALFPLIRLITATVPDRKWRQASRVFGQLTFPIWTGQAEACLRTLNTASNLGGTVADLNDQLLDLQSARLEFRLRFFSSPQTWQTPIELAGRHNLDKAQAKGRGAILWMMPLKFTEIISLAVLARSNYPVSVLSRPTHGISNTMFTGLLNRLTPVHFKNNGVERLMIEGNGQIVLDQARQRLHDNKVLTITTGPQSDRPATMHVFGRPVPMATGPARLAMATGAALLPVYSIRHGNSGYRTVIEEPLRAADDQADTPDLLAVMTRFVSLFEQCLREHPTEWCGWPAFT